MERAAWRFHLAVCAPCRRFRRQLAMLHGVLKQMAVGGAFVSRDFASELSAPARERIRRIIAARLRR